MTIKCAANFGDWSDDGHGKTEMVWLELSDMYDSDLEEIGKAYHESKAELGFGLEDIARDYDSTITLEQSEKLIEAGFNPVTEETGFDWEWKDDITGQIYLDYEMMLSIFEFMVGRKLIGFQVKEVKNDLPMLWGGGYHDNVITKDFVGYGLFHA